MNTNPDSSIPCCRNWGLVSIVIPCFRQGHLLPRALDSLQTQEYPNIEAIVVDDGSPESIRVPQRDYHFPVHLVRIENRGLPGARNEGLRHISGQWIKFLDADDALLPDCIALQMASLGGRTDCISTIGFEEIFEKNGHKRIVLPGYGDFREALLQINIGPPHIYLFPEKAIHEVTGFHEGSRVCGGHEDYDLVLRLSALGYYAVSVHKVGALYYRGDNTMSACAESMDRTRAAVWAAHAAEIVRAGGSTPGLLLAALGGWVRQMDVTPPHLAAPLEDAAVELAQLVEGAKQELPRTETNILRNRLLFHTSEGAHRLVHALSPFQTGNAPFFFLSPQEMIDRRLNYIAPWLRTVFRQCGNFLKNLDEDLWRNDDCLAPIGDMLRDIRVLSLDIFDTLLLRACSTPEDVYSAVGEDARNRLVLHPECSPALYLSLRAQALDAAYREMDVEPTLEDILARLPAWVGDPAALLEIEMEQEAAHCYLNPSVLSLVKTCRRLGIKIAFVSDMYLGKTRICNLLERSGFPMDWIDYVLVSVDEGGMKSTGELFRRLLAHYAHCSPQQILHIGDNLAREIVPASRLGISAVHYDAVHRHDAGMLDYESLMSDRSLQRIRSLRSLAMCMGAQGDGAATPWRSLGAGLLGPFMAAFAEWVVDVALREGADAIAPFMREAVLLTPMIKAALAHRGVDLPVLPLYVSRQAVALAGKSTFTAAQFRDMARSRQYFRIRELFSTLEFEDVPATYAAYADVYLENAWCTPMATGETLYASLETFLLRPENTAHIVATFERQRQALTGYVRGVLDGCTRVVTVDIGFFGQIQDGIESAFRLVAQPKEFLHLLAFGRDRISTLIGKGMRFAFFTGGPHTMEQLVADIHRSAPVLEQLLMLEEGSTVGYTHQEDGHWTPVLEPNPIQEREIALKREVHAGARDFQRLWFSFADVKPVYAQQLVRSQGTWISLVYRLLRTPTPLEAQLLGGLHNDTNFGSTRTVRMCPEEETAAGGELAPAQTFARICATPAVWPMGVLTRAHPDYLIGPRVCHRNEPGFQSLFILAKRIRAEGVRRVHTLGADVWTQRFIRAAAMQGIIISSVIDDEMAAGNGKLLGIPVVGLASVIATTPEGEAFYLVAPSRRAADRYRNIVKDALLTEGVAPKIYLTELA